MSGSYLRASRLLTLEEFTGPHESGSKARKDATHRDGGRNGKRLVGG